MHLSSIKAWFDNSLVTKDLDNSKNINWLRCVPFIILHLSIFAGFKLPLTFAGAMLCIISYLIRMFAITAFFHRYFAHKTFKTSKAIEIIFAVIGTASGQRGPIWWASHHRAHHKFTDTNLDAHTPKHKGFIHSHMLWFMCNKNFKTQTQYVKDLDKKNHLKKIDRFDGIIPLIYLVLLCLLGYYCQHFTSIQLTPATSVYWGFIVSTLFLIHATFSINSFGHKFGKQDYQTNDESRNNWFLALITLGEGWHNNHHHWPISARQGFNWKQIDATYGCLLLMQKLNLINSIKNIPKAKIFEKKI